ncbi:MAG: FISUMP domain-containing protein [Kosmotogaceae bacterium]
MRTKKRNYFKSMFLPFTMAMLLLVAGSCKKDDDPVVEDNPPNAPSLLSPANNSDDVDPAMPVVLSWEEAEPVHPDGLAVAYYVYFDTDTSAWTGTSAGTGTSYTPSGITGLTQYFWKVEARDVNNAATSSETWSFTTINLPEDKATITWTSGDGTSDGDVGIMTDLREAPAKSYGVKVIEGSVWMTENLKFLPEVHPASDISDELARYYVYGNEGTDVDAAKLTTVDNVEADWNGDGSETTEEINTYETFGVLYNLKVVETVCPAGWHVATHEDWADLLVDNGFPATTSDLNYQSNLNQWIPEMIAEDWDDNVALYPGWPIFYYWFGNNTGVKLAAKETWVADPDFEFVYPTVTDPDDDEQADAELNQEDGTALMASNSSSDRNISGFSALAGGYIDGEGAAPTGLGSMASFWTSGVGEDGPIFINLDAEHPGIQKFSYEGGGSPGLSIRCVKDKE